MATLYRTQGYILRKNDLREADQIFAIYTKDFGKIDVLGRAIRKITSKLKSGIDIFYSSEIEFIQGKIYKILTDAVIIDKFDNIRNDLDKMKSVKQITDFLINLTEGQEKDKEIWNLLEEVFSNLNKNIIYYYFAWNLASVMGYEIDLKGCVICQKKLVPEKMHFSLDQHGIICSQCFNRAGEKEEISPDTIKILRLFLKKDWDVLSRIKKFPLGELEMVTEKLRYVILK
jgi:DNA repair protein RecO (recombination protein O)